MHRENIPLNNIVRGRDAITEEFVQQDIEKIKEKITDSQMHQQSMKIYCHHIQERVVSKQKGRRSCRRKIIYNPHNHNRIQVSHCLPRKL